MTKVNNLDNGPVQGRVFSYARWSSDKQAEGDSLRRQISQAEQWCARHGLTLSEERFVDSGISAYRGKNQSGELGRLVETLQAGDTLLVEDADRLSRQDWKSAMDFVDGVLAKGVKIVTLQNNHEITAESFRCNPGVFLQLILNAHLGHRENVKKAARVREAWVSKRAEIKSGTAIRQRLPGWLYHQKTFVGGKTVLGKVLVDEAKANTVREIFRLTLAGWSRRRIAKEFNAKNVPSVSGQVDHWNAQSILACIVRNPAVIGDYKTAEGEIIKGTFPAVVDERTFYAANASATGHKKLTTPQGNHNLVTSLVRCPTCGGNMRLNRKHKENGKVHSYLVCSGQHMGKTECSCRPRYEIFERSLLALMRESTLIRKAMGQQQDGAPDELSALRGRVQSADAKLNEMMAALEAAPSKTLAQRVQVLELEAEQMRATLQQREAEQKGQTPPSVAYEQFAAELKANVNDQEFRARAKIALRQVIDHIRFNDKNHYTVVIRGGGPLDVILNEHGFLFNPSPRENSRECDGVPRQLAE